MNAYRIGKKQFIKDLSGTGAALYGGRWNYPGYRVIYASESIPLAILEYIVKAGAVEDELSDLRIAFLNFESEVSVSEVNIQQLPKNWNSYPAPEELKKIGTNWLLSAESLILKIPAISAPESCNLLINPTHPEFNKVELAKIVDYRTDIRLGKKNHPSSEAFYHSRHGALYKMRGLDSCAPTCSTCHINNGNHKLMTSWGFFGIRPGEKDKEHTEYQKPVIKALKTLGPILAPESSKNSFEE